MYSQPYLDYNATTPCDQEVLEAMLPYFREHFGNPSSSHHPYGWLARSAVEDATRAIEAALGIEAGDLVWTSGSTESINTILKGACRRHSAKGNHIITTKAEHKAVLDTCAFLEEDGIQVTYLDVDRNGLVSAGQLRSALRPETILVSIMYANNETGVLQPLEEIAEITHGHGALLFSDTTQALGKVPLEGVLDLVDFACFSGHKVYGPKGVGLTYVRNNEGDRMLPGLIQGGGQQKRQRGGTINAPLIVGMAKAAELATRDLDAERERLTALRDRLEEGLLAIEGAVANNGGAERLPNTAHISFPFVDGGSLLTALSGKIAVSNGSACNSASVEPSHVLLAMGVERELAYASLRLSLGRYTKEQDIEKAIEIISEAVAGQRENNILWERRK